MSPIRGMKRASYTARGFWGIVAVLVVSAVVLLLGGCGFQEPPAKEGEAREFERFGLATDTSKRIVELDEFLSGGPPKDGIPALTDPEFETLGESTIPDDVYGVLVEIGDDVRFYPYNILVWHEIADEVVGGRPIAVTF